MNVKLINYQGLEKDCPVGFSWTTLFFGFLVPLFRGDLVGVLIHLLASVFSIGIFWLIWPFFYNKNYINRLLEKGYMPYSDTGASTLRGIGIRVSQSYESRKKSEKEKEKRNTPAPSFAAATRETSTAALESSFGETFKMDGGSGNKYDFDFTDLLSLAWPVSLMQGSLQKSTAVDGLERVSCTFSYQNVQSRQILYTQWELKCLDILKKPILTDNPIIIRNEYSIGPKGLATVKSSDVLPSGTRSFTPYLKAVLYGDQTVEEFSEENLVSLKPKTRAVEIEGSSESALEYYRQVHKLAEASRYLYEKNEEGIWTCAFCGTRNGQDAVECRLCSVGMDQQELCSKEHIEQSDALYQAHLEQVRKEREERERLEREEAERARKEREERERLEREREEQKRLESERIRKSKQRRRAVILVMIAALITLGGLIWSFVLKPVNEYKTAQEYYEAGAYHQAYEAFERLGDYKDSGKQSLEAYADYLKTEPAKKFRIEGYQLLLTSGYSLERMYALAEEMIELSQFLEGYRIFSLLGDYKDAKEQSLEAYADYLKTEPAKKFRIEGYQWLLDNSFPKEDVFASFSRVLEGSKDFDTRLIGYRWLDINGYENAKERMYVLAGEMLSNGRYLDAHGVYSSLGDYKDARNNAAGLTRKVTFDSNGGSFVAPITNFVPNLRIIKPANPSKDGYNFKAWYKDPELTILWDYEEDKVASDMTLYAKWRNYIIGDIGPVGGYIFYDKGSYSDGWRYLEAAPSGWSGGSEDPKKVWGGYRTTVGGTGTAIGTGEGNTQKIVAKFGNVEPDEKKADYAAKLCTDLVVYKDGAAYDDWFLPSRDELDLMYRNLKKNNKGGFSEDVYWSSSEGNAYVAWYQKFNNGVQGSNTRNDDFRVRPVRAF